MKNNIETKPWSILIYGQPKIGLSTLASQMPDPLFLNLDDNLDYLKPPKEIRIDSWDNFIRVGNEISNGKHPSGTLIVNHIERLWQYVCEYLTQKSNEKNGTAAQNISELSFAEWRMAIDLFESKLKKILSLRNTVLLSHEIAEIRNIRGLERTYFLANLERKTQMVVLNLVDAVGRLYTVEQDIRILSFTSQENQITGSRIPALHNRKFIFQDKDLSAFTQAIESIEKAHHTTRGTNADPQRSIEKSRKSTVFKGSRAAAY